MHWGDASLCAPSAVYLHAAASFSSKRSLGIPIELPYSTQYCDRQSLLLIHKQRARATRGRRREKATVGVATRDTRLLCICALVGRPMSRRVTIHGNARAKTIRYGTVPRFERAVPLQPLWRQHEAIDASSGLAHTATALASPSILRLAGLVDVQEGAQWHEIREGAGLGAECRSRTDASGTPVSIVRVKKSRPSDASTAEDVGRALRIRIQRKPSYCSFVWDHRGDVKSVTIQLST